VDGVGRFSRRWAHALIGGGRVTGSPAEVALHLEPLARRLERAASGGVDADLGRDLGTLLADLGYPVTEIVGPTMSTVLRSFVEDVLGLPADEEQAARADECLRDVAGPLADALVSVACQRALAEQEQIQRATLAAVRASETRFRALFTQTGAGIGMVTMSGHIIESNAAWASMMGTTPEKMRGQQVEDVVGKGASDIALACYKELRAGERDRFQMEITHEVGDGRTLSIDLSVSRVRCEDPREDFIVGIAVDVSERKYLRDRLRYEAHHDALTGLPNRMLFLERLTDLLAGPRPAARLGLCYIDLDSFKSVNDGLGHEVGDRLLIHVADRLRNVVAGSGSLLARLGGDEFGILVVEAADANELAEQVLSTLVDPVVIDGRELSVSASVGVVDTVTAGRKPDALLRAAGISLHVAKSRGRGRCESHDPQRNARQVTRATLATEMPAALSHGEFFLEYQPLVSLRDGQVRRVEALVRWRHPRLGLLQPDEFVPVAEESGHIVALGRWVLRTACRQAQEWHRALPRAGIGVNVNIAVGQLYDQRLLGHVRAVLDDTRLPSHLLHLELTESAVLGDMHGPLDALSGLASAGVRLAIDDFGTGYSNLGHLGRIPACELKIAGSFLAGTSAGEPVNDKILPAIISLAHSLGLSVTAEGVETRAHVERLQQLDCDNAQGWFFARPVPAEEIPRLVAESEAILVLKR
jgi:diguanylate cyclase (GGDEF)-like protein/PAS domain S-box-containing protein